MSKTLVFGSSILLFALALAEAAQPREQIVKPNLARPQIDRGQMEKPKSHGKKNSGERPKIETSAMSLSSRELAQRAKPQFDEPQFQNSAFEESFHNPSTGSQALFPRGRLHRKLRIQAAHSATHYITGSQIKQDQHTRLRGHFLYHGKADREISPD